MSQAVKGCTRPRKTYLWNFRTCDPRLAQEVQQQFKVTPPIARVLACRDFDFGGLLQFMQPTLASLHDPFLMKDMDKAVARVMRAIQHNEPITVYGDYDTDGVTSTALLLRVFEFLKVRAGYYIPHRIDEGYGLNCESLEGLAKSGTRVVITVDNGICCNEQIARATELGVDMVVTDHHQPGVELPAAIAVIDPNRADCEYPNKYLTGVGVAFKFAHALLKQMKVPGEEAVPLLRSLLDLVALGTIADFAPLLNENRTMVRFGLEQITKSTNVGVQELKRTAEADGGRVTAHKIGFLIAPRLNAAGRTNSAHHCVELLTTKDRRTAEDIVQQLETFNTERRSVESAIFEECRKIVEGQVDLAHERVIVVSGPGWHVGVVGIVASRLVELFDRPAIVLSEHDGHAKGSARSIKAFNIHDALTACRDSLITFGGHPHAAGLQVATARVAEFRQRINAYAHEFLPEEHLQPHLTIDTEISATELTLDLLRDLQQLEPHGPSNPHPLFAARGLKLTKPPRIVGNNHLKLEVSFDGRAFNAIGFNMGELASVLARTRDARFDVAFCPCLNTFGGKQSVDLELKDLKLQPAS